MTEPRYCSDCKYSIYFKDHAELRCTNPYVNKENAWALAYRTHNGSQCYEERNKRGWFTICGIKGKKWEQKSELAAPSQ